MSHQIQISNLAFDALQDRMGSEESHSDVILQLANKPDPSTAVIQFVLENQHDLDDPLVFLQLWNEGEFDTIREEWSDIDLPDEIFIGADSQFVPRGM